MKIYPELSQSMRQGKRILKNNSHLEEYCSCCYCKPRRATTSHGLIYAMILGILTLFFVLVFCIAAHAEPDCQTVTNYNCTQIVDAIYKVENSKAHPYGIMAKYKHTTPRQACFNTVYHLLRDFWKDEYYGADGDFLHYLAVSYAPIGVSNDPTGLNRNWERNLRFMLQKGA